MRSALLVLWGALPSLFGLAPCGVYLACGVAVAAVRSYRTFSPLPRCEPGRFVFCGTGRPRALTPASRTLSGTLPCGVRTFLPRSLLSQTPAATARSSCQLLVYREIPRPSRCLALPLTPVSAARASNGYSHAGVPGRPEGFSRRGFSRLRLQPVSRIQWIHSAISAYTRLFLQDFRSRCT
jgi:hypothetical protein